MSREETIKPPRLVIPGILLWLVDVYLLHSTRSTFLGLIHLTHCHWTHFPSSTNIHSLPERSAGWVGMKCKWVMSVFLFAMDSSNAFHSNFAQVDTDLLEDLH